jgi:hypothetical protein
MNIVLLFTRALQNLGGGGNSGQAGTGFEQRGARKKRF